jgi:WD40 repeat protein
VAQSKLRNEVYDQDVMLAYNAWARRDMSGVERLLQKQIPTGQSEDLRGFEWHLLRKLAHVNPPLEFVGHKDSVRAVRVSRDGQSLYSVSRDGTMRKWDIASRKSLWERKFPDSIPSSICIPDTDEHFFVGGGQLHKIDPYDGSSFESIDGFAEQLPVSALAVAPQNDMVAAIVAKVGVKVGKMEDDDSWFSIAAAPSFRCRRIGFSPDGERLYFTIGGLNRVRPAFVSWDTVNRAIDMQLYPPGRELLGSVAVSPQDGLVAIAGDVINLFDPRTSEWIGQIKDVPSMPLDVEFDASGRRLACSCKDGSLLLVTIKRTPQLQVEVVHSAKVSDRDLNTISWLNDNQVVTGDQNGRILLHTFPELFQKVAEYPGGAWLLNHGEWLLAPNGDGQTQLVDCATLEPILVVDEFRGQRISATATNPAGTHLAIASGRTCVVWDLANHTPVGKFVHEQTQDSEGKQPWRILDLDLDDHGNVATVGHIANDFSFQMRNVSDLTKKTTHVRFSGIAAGVELSLDGERAAVSHFDGLTIFRLADMKRTDLVGYRGPTSWISPTMVLLRDRAKSFYLYDIEQDKFVATYGSGSESHAVQRFIPIDESTLMTCGSDGLRLWDTNTHRHVGFVPIELIECDVSKDKQSVRMIRSTRASNRTDLHELKLGPATEPNEH